MSCPAATVGAWTPELKASICGSRSEEGLVGPSLWGIERSPGLGVWGSMGRPCLKCLHAGAWLFD